MGHLLFLRELNSLLLDPQCAFFNYGVVLLFIEVPSLLSHYFKLRLSKLTQFQSQISVQLQMTDSSFVLLSILSSEFSLAIECKPFSLQTPLQLPLESLKGEYFHLRMLEMSIY